MVIDRNSHNLIKELRNYKWKTNGDITLDEPVKLWDDACDALRYAMFQYHLKLKKEGSSFGFEFINF